MCGARILCIVVSLGGYEKTLESICEQTEVPERIVVADKVFPQRFVGERAGMAMRDALSREDLDGFTHLLRVDGDVTFPRKTFIEEALARDVDLVGQGGFFQLLRVSAFKDLFDCIYPVDFCEDSCISWAVIWSNKHSFHKGDRPCLPPPRKYTFEAWMEYGAARYRFDYSFFRMLAAFRNYRSTTFVGFKVILVVMGYLRAKALRQKKHCFCELKKSRIYARKRDFI